MRASVDGDPQAKLCAQEEQIAIDRIFFDHVGVSADATLLRAQRCPRGAEVGSLVDVRLEIAKSMAIKCGIGGCFGRQTGLEPRLPLGFRPNPAVAHYIAPALSA